MKLIKVANILEEGRLGGPQLRIAEVSKILKNMGVDNTVVYPFIDSERFTKKLMAYGIQRIQFPLRRLTREKRQLALYGLFFLFEFNQLYLYFKKEKFDVIHVSGGSWQFKGLIAGKLAGCKTLWHLNDTRTPVFFRYLFKILSLIFADGLIVAGEKVRSYYVTDMGTRNKPVYEIQAPVDTTYFKPDIIKPVRKILSGQGLNIVSVGNINPAKGYETFIQMAGLLKEKALNFYVVGPHFQTQKAYSRKLIQLKHRLKIQNLTFLGYSDNIKAILNETDIYVCTSATEASPMAVWDAMSMEKAVVSTDVGDVPRLIENGENGFIVPCGSPEKLVEKVRILLDDADLRKTFGIKARQTAVEQLDVLNIASLHKRAYLDIIKK